MLSWEFKPYHQLTIDEFHDLVALRVNVFVVEQDCPYPELDGNDKLAHHLICKNENNELVGTLRILPKDTNYPELSIGRVVINPKFRGQKLGHEMMEKTLLFIKKTFNPDVIKISAQKHLEKFYNNHNFVSTGKEYLEDGIPHVEMIFKTNKHEL